jgi:hypothetical protein
MWNNFFHTILLWKSNLTRIDSVVYAIIKFTHPSTHHKHTWIHHILLIFPHDCSSWPYSHIMISTKLFLSLSTHSIVQNTFLSNWHYYQHSWVEFVKNTHNGDQNKKKLFVRQKKMKSAEHCFNFLRHRITFFRHQQTSWVIRWIFSRTK